MLNGLQGKLDEAEAPMREALAIRRKALGMEHPLVAESLNNLAQLLRAQVGLRYTLYSALYMASRVIMWKRRNCREKVCASERKL